MLGLTCLLHYNWAGTARALVHRQDDYEKGILNDMPPWVGIEKNSIINSSLPALLFSAAELPQSVR